MISIPSVQAKEVTHRKVLSLKAKAEMEANKLKEEIEEAKKKQANILRKTRQDNAKLCKEKRSRELEAARLRRNESRIR